MPVKTDCYLKIFDAKVYPILLYGTESGVKKALMS
jgi:hypothetical protein